ncbi:MAG TPA: calcium-translocating P-type ATPase, PMCA-type, partial [Candidatus Parabacteroides intestinavium]|nr:calcium-translocating P-type ATPase, PMCA-type [Candidatus Parabacteroides intestinavium]
MENKQQYQGLNPEQVAESRRLHGENVLTPPEKTSLWKQFLEKFEDPIIRILLVAWVLSMVIAGVHCWGPEAAGFSAFLEPLGIFFAIMLASCVGFFFEVKANRAFDVLNTVNDDILVTVVRGGKITEVPRRDIVVGDVVLLGTGDEVPADGHLLEAVSLQINESTLTGEPLISKTTREEDFDAEATYPSNVVMRGTTVVDGHGVMVVEQVGDATGYGKVYEGSQIDNNIDTPLQIQLKGLANVISKAGYTIAVVTFLALAGKMILSGESYSVMEWISHLLNFFMVAVTLIVVSVPEGLPMSVTLSLALSMNRMLKTNNLVRKMHACETMGATTVICTDKTGTLTQNQMQVHETKFYNLTDQKLGDDELSKLIQEGIAVNSTANLERENGTVKTLGNPTEAALLLWLNAQQVDYLPLREAAEVVSQLTFSTERKYMATVVKSSLLGKKVLYVKGAPEIVLSNSRRVAMNGAYVPVEEARPEIERQLLAYQNQAMRTLGFAYQILDEGADEAPYTDGRLNPDVDLTYIGIVAISDPVRKDVPAAVQSCIKAGISVKIVTGDTPGTAREIGRQIGIWKPEDTDRNIITGPAFEALSDKEALDRVLDLKIMCRARPTDKQRLVQLLQQKGAVVAVTGDGTNDAPALKAAQVGLSMGDGTSVAKEASDITILDNSFSSITRAVMWGRSLYRNIQRFLLFQLTINVAACLIVLLGSLIGTESPLTITQMLWVNLIMDTFAAGALASLPPNERVMNDKPRRSGPDGDFIITRPMAYRIFGVGIVFVAVLMGLLLHFHASEGLSAHDLSWFFSFFVMLQFWNMFNAKAFMEGTSAFAHMKESKSFLFVAALILVGQYLIVTFGGQMFNVVPLSWKDWGVIIGSSSLVLWVGEI